VGRSVFALVAKKDRERAKEDLNKILEQCSMRNVEYAALTKDGREFLVELSANIIRDSSGNPIGFVAVAKDITQSKKAEKALEESGKKYRELVDLLPQIVFEFDERGNFTFANRKGFEFFGYTPEDFEKGLNVLQMFVPEDRERAKNNIGRKLSGEKFCGTEYTAMRKDGSKFPVMIYSSPIVHENKLVGLRGIVVDITERKQMEEALRESEMRHRALIENSSDIIQVVDSKGVIRYLSPSVQRILGYKPEELIGRLSIDVVHPDDLPKVAEGFEEAIQKPGIPVVTACRCKHKDGTWRVIEGTGINYLNRPAVNGFISNMHDITKRKQMEEKLRQYSDHLEEVVQKRTEELLESEKRYSVLVEEASDGVVIAQDGKIVFANKKAQEIGGYPRDELISLPFERLVDENFLQLVKERHERRLQGEKVPATYEVEVIAKTGERVLVEISAARIDYQGRSADLVIVRDIRERKQMEEERLKLEKLATMGELATMVGHDLRNPLQSIENAVYHLNNELTRLSFSVPQKAMEMLQVINDSVSHADKIIRDLKDFSATKKPILKKTNINAVIKEALSQAEAPKNVEVTIELGHLPEILADKDMIRRVFLNSAVNGIQAMENGGRLKVSSKKKNGFVEVVFKDTGVGIPKESMEKLFTPFFTTKAKGMGMGLAICKKFVESHGGSIEIESEEGIGSTLTIKLPIQ
ncbi:MAG: PAS domain S-box protein, partial [Candidatus Bathyarchaeota archaeon]|nr:PAS domain S-box protein [Candidatus Bathyarchaeota archaeon]